MAPLSKIAMSLAWDCSSPGRKTAMPPVLSGVLRNLGGVVCTEVGPGLSHCGGVALEWGALLTHPSSCSGGLAGLREEPPEQPRAAVLPV